MFSALRLNLSRLDARAAFAGAVLVALTVWIAVFLAATAHSGDSRLQRAALAAGAQLAGFPFDRATLDGVVELPAKAGGTDKAATGGQGDGVERVRLSDLLASDGVVLVNFWATWCRPCLDELPSLAHLARAYSRRPLWIVAVSYDEDWPTIRKVVAHVLRQRLPDRFVLVRDPQPQADDSLRLRWGTAKLPETWVVSDGRVLHRFVGGQRWDDPAIFNYLDLVLAQVAHAGTR